MAETENVRPQGVARNSRQYGVFRWGLLVSVMLFLLLVAVVALVVFIGDGNTVVVLTVLVFCLIIVVVAACFFLDWLHRRAMRRRDEGAKAWIHRTLSENQLHIAQEPTPSPEPNAPSLSPRSSWIHWAPWRKSSGPPSSRSTGPPSSRGTGPPSSRSTGPPSYSLVARDGR